MSSEKVIRYLEIVMYLIVLGSLLIGSEDVPMMTKYYYYGMKSTSWTMTRLRRAERYFMENYFDQVNN